MTEDTKFKRGVSGNPAGRPKGRSNKAMTDRQVAELLSKGTKHAFDAIASVIGDKDESGSMRLRAAIAWIDKDESYRKFLYNKVKDELDRGEKGESKEEPEEKPAAAIFSLTAVEK